jgi:hypothetical protein
MFLIMRDKLCHPKKVHEATKGRCRESTNRIEVWIEPEFASVSLEKRQVEGKNKKAKSHSHIFHTRGQLVVTWAEEDVEQIAIRLLVFLKLYSKVVD